MTSYIALLARNTRSSSGLQDYTRATDYLFECVSYASFLSSSQQDLAKRVSVSANRMHNAFSVSQTVFNAAVLTAHVREAIDKGLTGELGKKIAIDTLFTTNTTTQALLLFKKMDFVKLAAAPVIDAIYNVTNVLLDAKDLYEMFDADNRSAFIDLLRLVRSISSIASAALALGALVFVALQSQAVVIVSLVLSLVWIASKIAVKILEELRKDSHYTLCKEKF
jgi:hypothetical protein